MSTLTTFAQKKAETKGHIHKLCIIQGRLDGKLAIVTGANAGIGEATVGELARRGAAVIMACRSRERAEAAKDRILNLYGASNPRSVEINVGDPTLSASLSPVKPEQLQIELLNLADLQSVRNFANRFKQVHEKLDYLINNAAIMQSAYGETLDGHEKVIGVNYLGHFLLTELLLPLLKKATTPSRIIFVSSDMHRAGQLHKPDLHIPPAEYGGLKSYRQSKLAMTMYAAELGRKLTGCGVVAVSVHPGMVRTKLNQGLTTMNLRILMGIFWPFAVTPWVGAQTILYTALTNRLVSGAYYENCAIAQPNQLTQDTEQCRWLWNKSCELVGLEYREKSVRYYFPS